MLRFTTYDNHTPTNANILFDKKPAPIRQFNEILWTPRTSRPYDEYH